LVAKIPRMDSRIKLQRVYIRKYRIKEVIAKPLLLGFIKIKSVKYILLSILKYLDPHEVLSRMLSFA